MHMADALISPAVGGTLWAVTAGLLAFCARRTREMLCDNLVPLMGVLGAFIFAAQMINFTIPGTGSSGHLGGGLILAVLLGPYPAFLVIASVLTVQAFFFADGGLLALGCNIFNLGFFPSFIAYPFIYKPLARGEFGSTRAWMAALFAAVVGLQLGAFSVVMETMASGISDLPFRAFVLLMQPIHLAIGVVEGLATAVVVAFVARARPEVLSRTPTGVVTRSLRPVLLGFALAALVVGGGLSWFASAHPDGLEWALARATGREEMVEPEGGIHQSLAQVQEKAAFLPDYGFKSADDASTSTEPEPWPAVQAGTSVAGLVGGLLTLTLAVLIGWALKAGTAVRKSAGG
jgi:cobalt/nickel transport system permease protein